MNWIFVWLGGGYVKLPFGETRYYNFGNPDGIKLVFVHGIGPPSPVFLGLIRHLGVEKYNFLLYDLFGRGYSESPGIN